MEIWITLALKLNEPPNGEANYKINFDVFFYQLEFRLSACTICTQN